MRVRLGYMIMLLISASCGVSAHAALPAHIAHSAKLVTARAVTIDQVNHSQHCDQLEDAEEIIAAYIQPSGFGPALMQTRHSQLPAIYTACATCSVAKRNNARIKPFYRLILFPFHAFW